MDRKWTHWYENADTGAATGAAPSTPSDVLPGTIPTAPTAPAAPVPAAEPVESYTTPIDTAQIEREMNAYQLAQMLQGLNSKVEALESARSTATGKAPAQIAESAEELPAEYANDPHMQQIWEVRKLAKATAQALEGMGKAQAERERASQEYSREQSLRNVKDMESTNVRKWVSDVLVAQDAVLSKNPHAATLVKEKVEEWLNYRFRPSLNQADLRHQYGMLQMELDGYLRRTIHPAFSQPTVREVVETANNAAGNNLSAGAAGVAPKAGNPTEARYKGGAKDFSDMFRQAADRTGVRVG